MIKVLALAWNTWLEILSRRVMILFVLFALVMGAAVYGLHREVLSQTSDEAPQAAVTTVTMMVEQGMGVWVNVLVFLGAFLGCTSVAGEFRTRTALPVLARPVQHWQFLLGKWLGLLMVQLMLLAFAALALAALITYYNMTIHTAFGDAYTNFVWYRLADFAVRIATASGLGVALGSLLSPVVAGALTLVVCFADPTLFKLGFDAEPRWFGILNEVLYYLFPARLPNDFYTQWVMQHYIDAPRGFFAGVIAENLLYAIVVFAFCAILFAQREGAARE